VLQANACARAGGDTVRFSCPAPTLSSPSLVRQLRKTLQLLAARIARAGSTEKRAKHVCLLGRRASRGLVRSPRALPHLQ